MLRLIMDSLASSLKYYALVALELFRKKNCELHCNPTRMQNFSALISFSVIHYVIYWWQMTLTNLLHYAGLKSLNCPLKLRQFFCIYLLRFNCWTYLSESHWISAFVVTRIREDQQDCQLQNTVVAPQQADTGIWRRHWLNIRHTDIAPFCNQCSRHLRFYDWTNRTLR